MKWIYILLMLLILIGSVYAVIQYNYEFTNGMTEENLTYTGNQNITRYIEISRFAYVTNVSMNIKGDT